MDMSHFDQMLANLMSTCNTTRSKAEEIYEQIPPKDKIQYLFIVVSDDSKPDEIRDLSAVLLRRALYKNLDDIDKESKEFSDQLKSHILTLAQKDNLNLPLRKKIMSIISELAKFYLDNEGKNTWPEVLHFMFAASNSSNQDMIECSLFLLYSTPAIFGQEQHKYLEFIKKMLLKCLCEVPSDPIKLAALKATTAFLIFNSDDKTIIKALFDAMLPILHILNSSAEKSEDEALTAFIDLVDKCPQLIRPHFNTLMEICMKAIINENLDEKVQHSAIEVIVSYCETSPSTVRKRGQSYLAPLVKHLLTMMTDLDDDPNWAFQDAEDDDDDADSNNVVGETALDRIACAVGGKTIFPIAIEIISEMLQSSDWKQRYAGLMAISALGEGCHKQMLPVLQRIVDVITPFITDPHPRVRFAICNAFGQLASDFAPNFEKDFHGKFIPGLLLLLDDHQHTRVQGHAAAAFVNFFEESTQKNIINYVPAIVDKFEEVLKMKIDELAKKGTKLVLEQIVVSIASLADVIQETFINYYDRFMPYLTFIIENANAKELRLLRGKAIECASLIGHAVGAEKFCQDASQIMDLLLRTQTGEVVLEDDDPQLSYMITSWVRICKLLGSKFEPYLPLVMPQVLKTASMTVEMALMDQDEIKTYEGNSDWQCFSLDDQQTFGIKVSGLDEKATACEMLVCYARELKQAFVPYLEETAKILVPHLKFYFHEGVRMAAAQSPPALLDCAKVQGESFVLQVWSFILPDLLAAIEGESDKAVLAELLVSLADCITTIGVTALNEEQMTALMRVLQQLLEEHFTRSKERQEKRDDEDYDDGVEEALNDEDDNDVFVLTKLVDVLHSLFSAYNDKFLPFFNQIFKHVVALASSERSTTDQQWAICIMDDLIEFCGVGCLSYGDFIMPLLSNNIKSPHAELRQAAAYGLGVLAKHGGETFAKFLSENLSALVDLIQKPDSRSLENIFATENAISAFTKIIQFNNSMIDVEALLPHWLSWLPIWEDEDEVIYVYSFLYQLLESNHQAILGKDNVNVPHIVSGILELFARQTIDPVSELGIKLVNYIKFVNLDASITSNFTAEQQHVLEQMKTQ